MDRMIAVQCVIFGHWHILLRLIGTFCTPQCGLRRFKRCHVRGEKEAQTILLRRMRMWLRTYRNPEPQKREVQSKPQEQCGSETQEDLYRMKVFAFFLMTSSHESFGVTLRGGH